MKFALNDVRLDPSSLHGQAQQTNLEYLLMLDVDRLVWSFLGKLRDWRLLDSRMAAGRIQISSFVVILCGFCFRVQVLVFTYSALSLPLYEAPRHNMWASTLGNDNLQIEESEVAVVSVFGLCQQKLEQGILSAFPSELFDRFEQKTRSFLAPYYIDSQDIGSGFLLDQYTLAGNDQLKDDNMDGLLCRLRLMIYPNFMQILTFQWLLDLNANDELTVTPIIRNGYILHGQLLTLLIAMHRRNIAVLVRIPNSLCRRIPPVRFFQQVDSFLARRLRMMRIMHHFINAQGVVPVLLLFACFSGVHGTCSGGPREMAYADYYERALTNGVLSIQRGKDPGIIYQLPLVRVVPRPKASTDWGTKYDSFLVLLWDRIRPSKLQVKRIASLLSNYGILDNDDRPEYGSIQAIFYGPYLLAGLSSGDWEINAKSATSFSDWITPIPAEYNSQLISLSQESGESAFAVTNSDNSLILENIPQPGTNSAVSSSFRLVLKEPGPGNFSGPGDAIGKLVMLESFNLPGMFIVHYGEGKNLGVAGSSAAGGSVFRMVAGLDGKNTTVSLESADKKGCFFYSDASYKTGTSIKLSCNSGSSSDEGFKQAASFTLRKGYSEYHPISFIAKGVQRNFLLSPLLSLRDESYTVYFNIHY
ncbi:hypothetical protein Sango_0319000 [Sesamum angolense]|uniref:Non-reducing end beta-L-arabinofuranosidase-like GH127 catalytic domain-containing protein n=1 Tax=Sesamum angolense TaxID=2727404 RepID=A0AAE1X8T4_9LAMI|nr:hypothetical protein Sango_0319000 [Sesamum angolense]